MTRAGRVALLALALLGAAPAAAERPTPSIAQRFAAALNQGDLRAAQRLVADEQIGWSEMLQERAGPGPSTPVALARIIAAVRGCTPDRPSASRDIANPRRNHVFLDWDCSENLTPFINLDVIDGRLTHIDVYLGPPIPLVDQPPGWVPPLEAPDELADSFLDRLVGDRDFAAARERLTADASLIDRRSGRAVSLAAIANHVEPCSLRVTASGSDRSVVTHWNCPGGRRIILIGFNGNKVSRIELLPGAGGPAR